MSTQADIAQARDIVKAALDLQAVSAGPIEVVWMGPRSTEVGMLLEDGREVTLSVSVKVPGQ